MSEEKFTINTIRNILMNEMGLSRKAIKDETRNIIEETVNKFLKTYFVSEEFEKLLLKVIDSEIRNATKASYSLHDYIKTALHASAKEWVDKNIAIHPK